MRLQPGIAFLHKPFTSDTLGRKSATCSTLDCADRLTVLFRWIQRSEEAQSTWESHADHYRDHRRSVVLKRIARGTGKKRAERFGARVDSRLHQGYIFTAGGVPSTEPGSVTVPGHALPYERAEEADWRDQGAGRFDDRLTGITMKGQYLPGGVAIGGGVRVGQDRGRSGQSGRRTISIDVEGWARSKSLSVAIRPA